jgi:pyruvate-formate lyase-activating enzyme
MPSKGESHGRRGCTGKKAYRTWSEADAALRGTLRYGRNGHHSRAATGTRLAPYRCRWCHEWHIGSEPKERGAA